MSTDKNGPARPRPHRVTQREIAGIVGVSSATVSYAFNGSPGVSDEIRDKILSVAKELGFRPNRAAQGLRLGRMNVIGLLLADIANPFYAEVAAGVAGKASRSDNQVFLAQVGLGGAMQAEAARTLVDHGCDGLVFTSVVDSDVELLRELQRDQVPYVFVNRRVNGVEADWVHIDDVAASDDACSLLLNSGLRRIAFLGGPNESSASRAREEGALRALTRAGLSPVHPELVGGSLTRESGRERAAQVLDSADSVDPADGILCGNDMIALGVMDVCHARGIRIPDDLSIVGFDDMSFASAGPLQLTTVSVPRQSMGERAAGLLLERVAGYDGPPREVLLSYQLQIRATVGAPVG